MAVSVTDIAGEVQVEFDAHDHADARTDSTPHIGTVRQSSPTATTGVEVVYDGEAVPVTTYPYPLL